MDIQYITDTQGIRHPLNDFIAVELVEGRRVGFWPKDGIEYGKAYQWIARKGHREALQGWADILAREVEGK